MKFAVHWPPSVNVCTPGCTVALDAGAHVGAPSAIPGMRAAAKTAATAAAITCFLTFPPALCRVRVLHKAVPDRTGAKRSTKRVRKPFFGYTRGTAITRG